MDFSNNGFEFTFFIDPVRLLHGKHTHIAEITKVVDSVERRVVTEPTGLKTNEIYGSSEQDAWQNARNIALEWAQAQQR